MKIADLICTAGRAGFFGGDEALMIQMNEMLRTLALIDAKPRT